MIHAYAHVCMEEGHLDITFFFYSISTFFYSHYQHHREAELVMEGSCITATRLVDFGILSCSNLPCPPDCPICEMCMRAVLDCTASPSSSPSVTPTSAPTTSPPTVSPTAMPSSAPTTSDPTVAPSDPEPSPSPSLNPTFEFNLDNCESYEEKW